METATSAWREQGTRHDLTGQSGADPLDGDESTNTQNPLDSEENLKQLRKMEAWRQQELILQAEARMEMAIDEDFYDGLQWTESEKFELEQVRGQPALVFNMVFATCRWVTGTQKRTRVDFKVAPREKNDVNSAASKTEVMKYLMDVNSGQSAISESFERQIIAGLGWLEIGATPDDSKEIIFVRTENWRNVRYDSHSKQRDLSDARYIFRERWVDLDVATARFPGRESKLRSAAESQIQAMWMSDEEFGSLHNKELYPSVASFGSPRIDVLGQVDERQRVKIIECWHREPKQCQVLRGTGPWSGVIYNDNDPVLKWALESGQATLVNSFRMQMRLGVYVEGSLLFLGDTPYWHNDFPLIPFWAWRRAKDSAPYGLVRNLRDPQSDLNKRRSKALHILSTRGIIADANAVDDWDELADEISRPDFIIKKRPGSDLKIDQDKTLAEEHVMLMKHDEKMIQSAGGVTDEMMGRKTNAVSGAAISARQDQGAATTADLFDSAINSFQWLGERMTSLIEQFFDQPKILRITGKTGNEEFIEVNQPGADGSVMNPMFASKSDFVIDRQAYQTTTRQSMYASMMELVTSIARVNPQLALNLLDLVVEVSDVPRADAFVARIRKLSGQVDPEAAEDPEVIAAEQAANEKQQALQERKIMAELGKMEGEAKAALAKGHRSEAQSIMERIKAMTAAFELGASLGLAPEVAATADELLADATRAVPRFGAEPPQPPPAQEMQALPSQEA